MALGDRGDPTDGMGNRNQLITFALVGMVGMVALGIGGCTPKPSIEPTSPRQPTAPPLAEPSSSTTPGPTATSAATPSEEGCPHGDGPDTLRLNFLDFGAPAMSFNLLGQGWWQWAGEGHGFDDEHDTIWVVVHGPTDSADLRVRFPVRPDELCDHRLIEVELAREYLQIMIGELEGDPAFNEVQTLLRQTLRRIDDHFGERASSPSAPG